MPVTLDDVCRAAWESTRAETAVAYDDLEPDYRDKLIERAGAVLGGEWPAGAWVAFETQVCALADERGPMQVGSDWEDEDEESEEADKPKKPAVKKSTTKKPAKSAAKKSK